MSTCTQPTTDVAKCQYKRGASGAFLIVKLTDCDSGGAYDLTGATSVDGVIRNSLTKSVHSVPGIINGDPINGEVELALTVESLSEAGWHEGEIDLVTSGFSGRSGSFWFEVVDTID